MATENFIWGAGGAKLTPEQIAIAKQLLARKKMQGADTSPVQHWTQGAARVADALSDVVQERRLGSQEKENNTYNSELISSLLGSGGTAAAIPAPGAAAELSGGSAAAGGPESYRDAIASIESAGSGDYGAVGPTHPSLGRALGRYQIMESNIGPWSKEALGRAVTPDEFLADPKLQDAIFDKKFGSYVQQYGPQGAAQAWFAGPGGVGKLDRKDSLGTSVGAYGDKFAKALGENPQVASLDPGVGMPAPAAATEMQNTAPASGYVDPRLVNVGPQQPAAPPLPEPTTIAAAPPVASVPPVQVAQAAPPVAPPPGIGNEALVRALTSPQANESTRRIASILLQQQQGRQQAILEQQMKQADPGYQADLKLKQLQADQLANPRLSPADEANIGLNRDKFTFEKESSQLTPDIKEYKFAKDNGYTGSFAQYQVDLKKASANNTTINNGEGNKFYNTLDENNAKIFSGLSDAGIQGRSKLGQIDQLEGLLQSTGSGWATALKAKAGDYGINTEKLDDIQAASAMLSKMIPEQRAPGSGPVSDADLAGFRNSLPRLINQPGGNATIINTMRGLTQYQVKMGEIADQVANREITPAEGRTAIANLPNPLSSFKAPPPGQEKEGWTNIPSEVPNAVIRRKN
jgi:hypothetical protein